MTSASSTPPSASSVLFPGSESPQRYGKPGSPMRPPYQPFRRISLPTAPSLLHRMSVASIASFDSLQEDAGEPPSPPQPMRLLSDVPESSEPGPRTSFESPRRRKRTRDHSTRPAATDRQLEKRRRIIDEFYETEKAYVEGLELIYSHFLAPIISSLDTAEPLLNRTSLTSIFSNFIDIWNLHRSFLTALTSLLEPYSDSASLSLSLSKEKPPPDLSQLLLSHFPYLSLYTPFVTAFPATISVLNDFTTPPTSWRPNPHYSQHFSSFLTAQETDPRCGKLKLRDWLLTIVQRCPRYLLLLKDLISTTTKEDPEHGHLSAVHALVSKITLSLNTSLQTHAQTMALLALQRATPNLPFQLISPGRNLVKRGSLVMIERSGTPLEREFLLFSDFLLWLAPAESSSQSWDWDWSWGGSGSGSGSGASNGVSQSAHNTPISSRFSHGERPPMSRSRSKSEAELPTLMKTATPPTNNSDGRPLSSLVSGRGNEAALPRTPPRRPSIAPLKATPLPPPIMPKRTPSQDDKWIYKGRVQLVDVQVIIGSALEDVRKFEILSPEGSFVLYAGSEEERDSWTSEIRNAKSQLLASLNITNPNSTLTSSSSTNHVRRALQALPYPPEDDRIGTVRASTSLDVVSTHQSHHGLFKSNKKDKEKEKVKWQDNFVHALREDVWMAETQTSLSTVWTMCLFYLLKQGAYLAFVFIFYTNVGVDDMDEQTFFIYDSSNPKQESKPARACDGCYESVFPLIDTADEDIDEAANAEQRGSDTITSLSHLPSWLSMPALPVQRPPQALMAIDLQSSRDLANMENTGGDDQERRARMRVKSHQRLRSYQQILEDFKEQSRLVQQNQAHRRESADVDGRKTGETLDKDDERAEHVDFEGEEIGEIDEMDIWYTPVTSPAGSPIKRREDTARRSKRFSLPAIAVHTTNVTARTSEVFSEGAAVSRESSVGGDPASAGARRSRRFSLVLAGRVSYHAPDAPGKAAAGDEANATSGPAGVVVGSADSGLARGAAAARLSELLGRHPK
ncbi:hypothetical protein D9619_006559 [Psilocybe cf. subviscida]|uniref:DH domain-containing protein n=1 Tax=Psilocybe cf. subviscida TaxID=2480587 RepID=A0A8H5EXL2_9AGAR|nr:hypothetical protein D9619_006559 [Psilocybe cf. subviscida]